MSSCCGVRILNVGGGTTDGVITSGTFDAGTGELTLNTSTGGSVVITGVTSGDNIYTADGALAGARTVDMAGNDITWQNGGDFIIDGKLTVTGLIDPTGLVFSGPQPDAGMPVGTIYITDGSASGVPSGEIAFKDMAGNYHALENVGGATYSPVTQVDIGTAAPADAGLGTDPATGDVFYVDAAGNWQLASSGASQGVASPVTAADIGTAAPAGIAAGVDPATGNTFYVDAAGNWQLALDGDLGGIDDTVTVADIGTPAPAGAAVGVDPTTGDTFYVDGAGNWQAFPTVDEVDDTVTLASVGTAAPADAHLGLDPATGDILYKDAGGNWAALSTGAIPGITTADVGTAAPAGATLGYDPATGDMFYVDAAGDWQAVPVVTVDLNTTVSELAGLTYGGGAAAGAPAAPDDGDVHVEVYDDAIVYWVAAGGTFPAAPQATFAVAAGTNIYNADGTLTGARTLSGADNSMTWNNVATFTVDQEFSVFPGSYGSTTFNTSNFAVNASSIAGTGDLDVSIGTVRLVGVNGTESGGMEWTNPAGLRLYGNSTSPNATAELVLNPDTGIDVLLGTNEDLRLNGDPGTTGQVLTSQGPDSPPIWAAAGADTHLANADLTADANHTHDFAGFDQYWNDLGRLLVGVTDFATQDVTFELNPNTGTLLSYFNSASGITARAQTGPNASWMQVSSGVDINLVRADNLGVDLNFAIAGSDLSIDGDPGNAGEVLTSNGNNAAPTWEPIPGKYVQSFGSGADWTLNGANYEITVAEATHTQGTDPIVQVEEGNATRQIVGVETEITAATGDVTIRVPAVPDSRFIGRITVA